MNIFEALGKGNGKVTKLCFSNCYVEGGENKYAFVDSKDCLIWNTWRYVSFKEIKDNDWIPYVPRKTCTEQLWLKYYKQYDEALAIGFSPETIEKVLVKPNEKVKHKEVFENVKWSKWGTSTLVFPLIPSDVGRFLDVPSMRITLEWEC